MPLIFAIIALNLAFVVYLFISLRRAPETFWDKSGSRDNAGQPENEPHQFYDAFVDRRRHQLAAVRSGTDRRHAA